MDGKKRRAGALRSCFDCGRIFILFSIDSSAAIGRSEHNHIRKHVIGYDYA